MTKVSVLSIQYNLRISECELKDNYYISFILFFKTTVNRYIGNSVIFKSQRGFSIAGAGYTYYPVRQDVHAFFFSHKNIIFDKITAILTLTFQTLVSSIVDKITAILTLTFQTLVSSIV